MGVYSFFYQVFIVQLKVSLGHFIIFHEALWQRLLTIGKSHNADVTLRMLKFVFKAEVLVSALRYKWNKLIQRIKNLLQRARLRRGLIFGEINFSMTLIYTYSKSNLCFFCMKIKNKSLTAVH